MEKPIQCLIITRNELLSSLYSRVLGADTEVRVVGLVELSKAVLKTTPDLRVVVLDFDLQDKNGTNVRIIKRIADKAPQIHLLILASHPVQKKVIREILQSRDVAQRIKVVKGLSKYFAGPLFLRRAKRISLEMLQTKNKSR